MDKRGESARNRSASLTTTLDVVARMERCLSQRIGESRYKLWFADKTKFVWRDDGLVIGVPNLFLHDWLEKTFGAEVRDAAVEAHGSAVSVRFLVDAQLFQAARAEQAAAYDVAVPAAPAPSIARVRPSRVRRQRSLADFVVGASNRVAHAAALSFAEAPLDAPNPLLLHGTVGTGKTHLLEGIAHGLERHHPDWRVLFVTAEEFTNRFVQAMHQHKLPAFRKQFRGCDALLIDDIGFLAKKNATQEELLHTLDSLQSEHRPIALTTDCHPRLADHFLPELVDRLVGGSAWSLNLPDRATRFEILRGKSARSGDWPREVHDFLADNLRGNARELEGAVHSIAHLAKATYRRVDVELAREALGDILRHSVRVVHLDDLEQACCEAFGVTRDFLLSKKRHWVSSYPRMLAMYLARKHTQATFSEVGKHFGGRNHSTVVAAEKKVQQWLRDNITLQLGKCIVPVRDMVEKIERMLAQ